MRLLTVKAVYMLQSASLRTTNAILITHTSEQHLLDYTTIELGASLVVSTGDSP